MLPSFHLADTGLASALLGVSAEFLVRDRTMLGQLLETFGFQELKRQASWNDATILFHHFRDKDGVEVDIVLEKAGTVADVEIKATATAMQKDFRGSKKLREARARYCPCVYETVRESEKLHEFAGAMDINWASPYEANQNEYNEDCPLLPDVIDASVGEMKSLDAFLPAW